MTDEIKLIKSFEKKLDQSLLNLKILQTNANECIQLFGELYENLYTSGDSNAFMIKAGLFIILPYLLRQNSNRPITKFSSQNLIEELFFASHYVIIRDYLYYTYNSEKSIKWVFKKKKVKITILDNTIPRQYFIEKNIWFLNSIELAKQLDDDSKQIISLLKGSPEFELNDNYQKVRELIFMEISLKFKYYHNFVEPTSEIDLGVYKYSQFIKIYSEIMFLALYNRYYAKANDIKSLTITYPLKKLIKTFTDTFGISEKVCKAIISDMSYCKDKTDEDPNLFPLIYFKKSEEILIIPSIVATSDGFINILRIWATRDPKLFLKQFSEKIGTNFVDYIAKLFTEKDFIVYKNIRLNKIQKDLPDIDLFIISKEPTLGFHIYIVEAKNPIPATWGKHYLKAIGKKGYIKKAFNQLQKIEDFLISEKGVLLIYNLIMKGYKNWSKDFKEGFFTPIEFFIVSSQNTGMLFTESNKTIIDYQSLKRIVDKSDGDVVYITRALKSLFEDSNKCYTTTVQEFQLKDMNVEYEVPSLQQLFDFSEHKYKSEGIDKEIAEEGKKMGYNFINTIDEKFIKKFTKEGKEFISLILKNSELMSEKKE